MVIIINCYNFRFEGKDVQIQEERDRADLREALLASLQPAEIGLRTVYQGSE